MHIGFNLESLTIPVKYLEIGKNVLAQNRAKARRELTTYSGADGILSASEMTSDWFPDLRVDVFISHSHSDANMAISLAGWLKEIFGLIAFVDSCVWGYAEDLLRIIDRRYCFQPTSNTYDYTLRNKSTSHVYMILQTALVKMMDNAECVMFLNTPSSIAPSDVIGSSSESATFSPWIYSELAMTRLLAKHPIERRRREKTAQFRMDEGLKMVFQAPTDHLVDISAEDLIVWRSRWRDIQGAAVGHERLHPLDLLYVLKEIE